MRKILAVCAVAWLVSGCREVDVKRVELLRHEIATIGSAAKTPGPRSPEQIARIEADVLAAEKHVDEVSR